VRVRPAVELGKPLLVLGREVVVEVPVDVAPERLRRQARPRGGGRDDLVEVRLPVLARPQERLRRDRGPHGPDGEDERQAGQAAPALREVEDVEAGQVGLEGGVAEKERGVVVREHLGEVGRGGVELGRRPEEILEEDAGHRGRGARRQIERDRAGLLDRPAAREDDAAHALLRSDPDPADDADARDARGLDRRDEAGVHFSAGEPVRAGGRDVRDPVRALDRAPEESPCQRPGVDVVDERNAECGGHGPPQKYTTRGFRSGVGDNRPCRPRRRRSFPW
jgi:hypothetical protein